MPLSRVMVRFERGAVNGLVVIRAGAVDVFDGARVVGTSPVGCEAVFDFVVGLCWV